MLVNVSKKAHDRHSVGTATLQVAERKEDKDSKPDVKSVVRLGEISPRLLDLNAGAAYLGVSYWTMRDYIFRGVIPQVKLPHPTDPDGNVLRRILIDRQDLDAFIERHKEKVA
ncbi:helix-turn-helix domain-containing protein [Acidobacteria bacterium AH-259-A15]|nr:helix-turn-helix domain-containing protein [Acidobacteria bacterium AH-259-A15]